MKTSGRNNKSIVERLIDFYSFWRNDLNRKNDSTPITQHSLEIMTVSYDYAIKWFVSKEELNFAANHIGQPLKKNQKILKLNVGEYNVELEINSK